MKIKVILFTGIVLAVFSILGYIYWQQEIQYLLPTPKPANLKVIQPGDKIEFSDLKPTKKGLFIHFFNGECPCSRFNIKDFERMVKAHQHQIDFKVYIQCEDCNQRKVQAFKNKFDLDIAVSLDLNGEAAASMGVYSTPQAVLLDSNRVVFYKGNYNKARFCVSKNTAFAEKAINAYINGEAAPAFPEVAYVAYGCTLPTNNEDSKHDPITGFFKELF